MLSKAVVFGAFVIVITYSYTKWKEYRLDQQEKTIIDAWNSSIKNPNQQFKRIMLGINCNLDLIVSGVELLTALKQKPGQPLDSARIDSLQDLTNTFTYYFNKGAAAERTFMDEKLYAEIIKTAQKLKSKEHYVGGNAALMAAKVAELFPGTEIQLVGPIGPQLKSLLPARITIPEDSRIPQDEVHLIMEYGLNEQWMGLTAPVANRFITSFDESNSKLTMLKTYFSNLGKYSPDLVLFGGLHLLDMQETWFVKEKMAQVKQHVTGLSPQLPVHLELASMANEAVVKSLLSEVLTHVTSLGLNEQEMTFASHVMDGPHADYYLNRNGQPEIHKVSDMVLWILQTYGYSKTNPSSKLTRVHFHSLTYHIIGTLPSAWKNSESAVAAGTRMAGQQACDTKKLSPLDIELRIPNSFKIYSGSDEYHFDENHPVIAWDKEGFHFVLSPVLVCVSPLKTVGLGDAISATGLMYSQYVHPYK